MIKACRQCIFDYSYSNYNPQIELKFKFKNYDKIIKNYSQSFQDIFVLTVLDGKINGTYLEIGSAYPIFASNTYLLEKEFNWNGIGIEVDEERVKLYNQKRINKSINADAKYVNYKNLLKDNFEIDYLQIDCEPARQSYEILTKMPFETHTFNVITFEHDFYCDKEKKYKTISREFLQKKGYHLVVSDVAIGKFFSYEDWWVNESTFNSLNKDLISINKMNCIEEYMYKDYKFNKEIKCTH